MALVAHGPNWLGPDGYCLYPTSTVISEIIGACFLLKQLLVVGPILGKGHGF
jgi:hypothetical protein